MDLNDYRNEKFSNDYVDANLKRSLQHFFALTARESFSVSPADEDVVRDAGDGAAALVRDYFDMMLEQVGERRRNLKDFQGIQFVSIGEDCFSRTILTQWGVKPFAKLGEKSGPFDLSVHPITSTIKLFQTDFEGYLDPENLGFVEKYNFISNHKVKVSFNHETGPTYTEDGFQPLIDIYTRRLKQFRAVMASEAPTVLVFHSRSPTASTGQHITQLWNAVKSRWSVDDKLMVCLRTWPHGAEIIPSATIDDPRVTVMDIHYPREGYVWHLPRYCFTREGFEFERRVVDFVKRAAIQFQRQPSLAPA
ncbi:hypothetical protein N825_01540 [Skermanella stibiiresistens SB22]|uniref:Uncharacterized protein n=1 Tax=Skermanella stibiiresistens SB22 TaxID=1385369 RepID=W9HA44_9PROT|nr:DUF1796 family putative cysteine peptidase [Skermanella stibiiresistens]EWY42844.1 hypothetical protein N825_01540 [Skermanella stibiiresistens SB22]